MGSQGSATGAAGLGAPAVLAGSDTSRQRVWQPLGWLEPMNGKRKLSAHGRRDLGVVIPAALHVLFMIPQGGDIDN